MNQQSYKGRRGVTYTLDSSIRKGGEGEVFSIRAQPNIVAKIYFDKKFQPYSGCADPRQFLREKIETMLDQPVDPYVKGSHGEMVLTVAWPQDSLYDSHGRFVGFVMPRVNSTLHLYHASQENLRTKYFPGYTWQVGLAIACNLVMAVKKVQATGAVIGDLNPNNVMLDKRGYVTLIDTDSFNITNKRTGIVYKCSVGVSEMLPPELQGRDLRKANSVFSEKTDSFALGIHIFSLLMNNCHPFVCTLPSNGRSSSNQCTTETNITSGLCPYVSNPVRSNMKIPNDAPNIQILPLELRELFDRTFTYDTSTAVKRDTINRRPSAEEWQMALRELYKGTLTTCAKNKSHVYPASYSGGCPWCEVESRTSPPPPPPPPRPHKTTASTQRRPFGKSQSKFVVPSPAMLWAKIKNAVLNAHTGAGSGQKVYRKAYPLWAACILAGIITGLFSGSVLMNFVYETTEFALGEGMSTVIMLVLGAGAGCIVAYLGTGKYERAYNATPWLLLALLTPVLTALLGLLGFAVVMLVVMIIMVVFYVLAAVFAIVCLCSMCDGA